MINLRNWSMIIWKEYVSKGRIDENCVLLDTCASISIFMNNNLLTDLRISSKKYHIYGIDGSVMEVEPEGRRWCEMFWKDK